MTASSSYQQRSSRGRASGAVPVRRAGPRFLLEARAFARAAREPNTLVLEVGEQTWPAYARGHVPGARYLDTLALEDPRNWNRRPLAELQGTLAQLGIGPGTEVLLVSRDPMAQYRAGWILEWAGVRELAFLDGGLRSWQQAGLPLERGSPPPTPALPPLAGPGRPRVAVDLEEVWELLGRPGTQLVDIRSRPEHLGLRSGYSYFDARGTLPGARWGGGGSDARSLEDLRGPGRRMAPRDQVEALWRRQALDPGARLVFFCGTGWRAAEAYWYARELGYGRPALYDGGWYEWSRTQGSEDETSEASGIAASCSRT